MVCQSTHCQHYQRSHLAVKLCRAPEIKHKLIEDGAGACPSPVRALIHLLNPFCGVAEWAGPGRPPRWLPPLCQEGLGTAQGLGSAFHHPLSLFSRGMGLLPGPAAGSLAALAPFPLARPCQCHVAGLGWDEALLVLVPARFRPPGADRSGCLRNVLKKEKKKIIYLFPFFLKEKMVFTGSILFPVGACKHGAGMSLKCRTNRKMEKAEQLWPWPGMLALGRCRAAPGHAEPQAHKLPSWLGQPSPS